MASPRPLVLLVSLGSIFASRLTTYSRRCCLTTIGFAATTCPLLPTHASATLETFTFSEKRLGLDLATSVDGIRIERIKPDSPAIAKGVPPLSIIVDVNDKSMSGKSVEEVTAEIRSASRPLTLRLDTTAFRALPAVDQTQAAATALGMETERINIELLTGPQDPSCAYKTREADVVEVEFSAKVAGRSAEFDSSEMRSGRPFAFTLGNGDVPRGLELGTMEMCIGEERRVSVPPQLGYGRRGSKLYGVPPDAPLEYRIKLVSINLQTDPKARREDVDDEQRFYEDENGRVQNAATDPPR